jgi:hypothetical protein
MRLLGVAALTFFLLSCSTTPAAVVSPSPTASPTPSVPATTVSAVSPSASATPFTTTPQRTPAPIVDPAQAIFSPQAGWRPTGTTVIVAQTAASGATALFAIPLDRNGVPGPITNIVNFIPNSFALRRDAGALALSVSTVGGRARLAVWEAATGTSRWLLPDDPDTSEFSPLWSLDGSSIYYQAVGRDPANAGLFVVRADGTNRRRLGAPDRFGGPLELTPDGQGIVWSRGQAGGSVDIFDIATGTNRHLEDNAGALAWRAKQPRLVLRSGGCCAGRPGGALELWDDVGLTSRAISSPGGPGFLGAAWDPSGTRIVAVQVDNVAPYETSLVNVDPGSGALSTIEGTRTASGPIWVSAGVVFARLAIAANAPPTAPRGVSEIALLPAGGGPPRSIYKPDTFLSLLTVVEP